MKNFIQSLSARLEFAFVVGAAFGYIIVISFLRGIGFLPQKVYDGRHLLAIVIFEMIVGAVLVSFLWLRNWRPRTIGLRPTLKDTGIGLLLLVAAMLAYYVVWYMVWLFSPVTIAHVHAIYAQLKSPTHPSVAAVLGNSCINATFEEVFVSGYVITAVRRWRSPMFAASVSVAIRLLYHLYQREMAFIGVLPLGLLFASWYVRSGRLWPLIVAHAIEDFVALMH
jgi:membrane protease YdiL (CAAX protease family)